MWDRKVGDTPGMSEALDSVAHARNEAVLNQDATAFVKRGVVPEDLPRREYDWPYPDVIEHTHTYKEALSLVLEHFYERHGAPAARDPIDGDYVRGLTDDEWVHVLDPEKAGRRTYCDTTGGGALDGPAADGDLCYLCQYTPTIRAANAAEDA